MDDQTVQRILTAHADALNQGVDNTTWLLQQFQNGNPQKNAELEALLKLARELKLVLVPVESRQAFVQALQAELLEEEAQTQAKRESPSRSWFWWGAAAAGSVAAGVAGFIVWRRSRPSDQALPTA